MAGRGSAPKDKLDLAARVSLQIGIVSDQYAAFAAGRAMTFSTPSSFARSARSAEHPSLPADLDVAASSEVTGDGR